MRVMTAPAHDIRTVAEVRPADWGARLAFADGTSARLESTHPDFDRFLWLAEWAGEGRPLGVVTDAAGRVVDLSAAQLSAVRSLTPFDGDPTRFVVGFWAHLQCCALTAGHPEFGRVYATLVQAAGDTRRPVWAAGRSKAVVEDDRPNGDGFILSYREILDVRPV